MTLYTIGILLGAAIIGVSLGKLWQKIAKINYDDHRARAGCIVIPTTGMIMLAMVFISFYSNKQKEYYGWISDMSFYKEGHGARSSSTLAMNISMEIQTEKGRKNVTLTEDRPEFLDIMHRKSMFTIGIFYSPITKDTTYKIIAAGATTEAIKNNGVSSSR